MIGKGWFRKPTIWYQIQCVTDFGGAVAKIGGGNSAETEAVQAKSIAKLAHAMYTWVAFINACSQ